MWIWNVIVWLFGLVIGSSILVPGEAFVPSLQKTTTTTTTTTTTRKLTSFDGQRRSCSLSATSSSSSSSSSEESSIVIVGGGFGGLNAALSLSSLMKENQPKQKIILLDDKERFVFLPLLYELCVDDASVDEVAPTYASLLSTTPNIEFVQGRVTGIDTHHDCLYYQDTTTNNNNKQQKMTYKAMIVATGAECQLDAIPGASHYALPFYTVEQCFELKRRFQLLESSMVEDDTPLHVAIVGGGYSGVELALNTVERLPNVKVTLIHRGNHVLENATPYNQQQGLDRLKQSGVEILTQTSVINVTSTSNDNNNDTNTNNNNNPYACTVNLQSKTTTTDEKEESQSSRTVDLLLWTAGASSVNRVDPKKGGILNSKLPRDSKGRIVTGKYMRVKGCTNVFAIGDCSRAKQEPYAATAQVAMQQAPYAAWNLYTTIIDKQKQQQQKMMPFSYLELGEMMTLGSDDATISSLQGLVQLSGPTASILRRLIYAVRMPTTQQSLQALWQSSEKRILSTTTADKNTEKINKKKNKKGGKLIQWK